MGAAATGARKRGRGRLVAVVAVLAVAAPSAATARPTGAAPPRVTAAGLPGSFAIIPQCDGTTIEQASGGLLKVERTDMSGELAIDVTYGGSLVAGTDYPALPDPVVIAAGETDAFLEVEALVPGTVTITVEPGDGYTVGDPATATSEIVDSGGDFGCQDEVVETIALGTTPTPLPIFDEYGFGVGDSTLELTGDVPPGLDYQADGSWTGAATELGTFEFTACYRIGDLCGLEIPFRITVVDEGPRPAPAPTPPPATPLPGTADFTG